MDWNSPTVWWVVAGALVAAELATGTFYLLMLGAGAVAAALAAHLGLPLAGQILTAALVGGAAVVALNRRRAASVSRMPASLNPDVVLDIGQTVQVDAWDAEGRATVHYRGAPWQARFVGGAPAQAGRHVIKAIEGSCLVLDR